MVARMVRDHKVVGSNPVASTINPKGTSVPFGFISWLGATGFEGRQAKLVLRSSAGLPPNKQPLNGLFTVRAAQGANPVVASNKLSIWLELFLNFLFNINITNNI